MGVSGVRGGGRVENWEEVITRFRVEAGYGFSIWERLGVQESLNHRNKIQ